MDTSAMLVPIVPNLQSHEIECAILCSHTHIFILSLDKSSSINLVGLVVGVTLAMLVLCSAICVGGIICAAVAAVVYRKKQCRAQTQQNNVIQQPQSVPVQTYRMSELADLDSQPASSIGVPIQYTPTPEDTIGRTGSEMEQDDDDMAKSHDEQPLII